MELIGILSEDRGKAPFSGAEKPAIITPDSTLTYKKLEENISLYTGYLKSIGVKKDDKVALYCENSPEYIVLVFAIWKTGAVAVPLNIRLLPGEIKELVSFAGCRFLFTDTQYNEFDNVPGLSVNNIPAEEEITNDFSEVIRAGILSMNDTALIIFTSGSTGKPKGVKLTFNNLYYSAFNGNVLFNHQPNDRWLASLPFYHIGGFSIITRSLFYGAAVIIPGSLKTDDIKNSIENFKPTLASLVTTQLQRLMESGCKPNKELRCILLGGGFLETSLVNNALKSEWNVIKSYGASETSSFVTFLGIDDFRNKPESAGKAVPPNEILIVDDNKLPLPAGTVGEIAVKAQSVAGGYINNNEESVKKFSGDIYYSGDYGHIDDEGFLYIEARREDLIVSGGENIIPAEVEREIKKYPGIKEACVFGLEDKEWGHIAAAALVINNPVTAEELKEFLKDKLPSFKHPRKVFIINELPRTELGKVQKGLLREKFKD